MRQQIHEADETAEPDASRPSPSYLARDARDAVARDIVAGGVDEWSDYGDTDDEHAVDFAAALEDSRTRGSLGRVARVARDARGERSKQRW